MKYFLSISLILVIGVNVMQAQQATTTAGETINTPQYQVSYAIGEVLTANHTVSTPQVVSGVIQPQSDIEIGTYEIFKGDISIAPNPAESYVDIIQEALSFQQFEIYSIDGALVRKGAFETRIDGLENLVQGAYALRLIGDGVVFNSILEKL